MSKGDVQKDSRGVLRPLDVMIITVGVLLTLNALMSPVNASTIDDTHTSKRSVTFLINCTASPCNASLYNINTGALVNRTQVNNYTWGVLSVSVARKYELTLTNSTGDIVDSTIINMGTFESETPTLLLNRLGPDVIGYALIGGASFSGVLLGFEGGFLLVSMVTIICAGAGLVVSWVVYLIILISGLLAGLGIWFLVGGLK